MKNFKNLIKEAHLGNPLNENKYLSNKDSYIKISEPSFRKDKNNPNFLSGYIKYDTGPGVGIALGKETMAGQIRRLSSQEAVRQMEIIARKLNDSFDIEDIEVTDLENGVVELFAVSDDFIDMDPRSELSMAMLGENQKYDDEDIVIYDGEEHIIMSRDGNMIYIRPLEDSAILGKKDVIKVPARALAYKSDLDKMYDEYKPKDEVNEEFSSTEQKMIKQIQSYKKRDSAMVNLPSKVRDFYFKNKEKIDALNENMGEWPKELTSRYSDEYRFELEKVSPTYQDKPGRAKYRVIDIESGELKGTPVFGKPESLMAYADDLIKPQGGTQSTNLGESLDEDINDPALVRARAAKIADEKEKSKQAELDKKYGSNFMDKLDAEISLKQELQDLKDEREQLMIDMEQEAEPEGGEIADLYGMKLNRVDLRTAEIKSELDDLRMYESVNEDMNENTLGDLVKKYGKDLINFVIDIDELTKEEIKDIEYLDDRIQIHLEEPEIRQRYLPEGTCGYTPDGEPRSKPAGPDLNEDDELNVNIDNANTKYAEEEDKVANSGAYESLQKSLREKLQERLK
jgi:hypothetical protein